MKPPPAREPPVKPTTVATAGSRRTMSTTWRSFSPIACVEMLWSARRPPLQLAGVLLREEALRRDR